MRAYTTAGFWNILIGALFGIAFGGLITAGIVGRVRPPVQHSRLTRFGDVAILTLSIKDEEGRPLEELVMRRNGKCFFSLMSDASGKAMHLAVAADGRDNIRFLVSVSPESDEWANATYGGTKRGTPVPQQFEDVNFDGTFDILDARRESSPDDGEVLTYIACAGKWMKVDRFKDDGDEAICGSKSYTFRKELGWCLTE